MLHLSLACNLLNSVDGKPKLAFPYFIPEYSTKLPQADVGFEIHIEACSDSALATFQRSELPSYPLPVKTRGEVGYRTIGEFYENVKYGFQLLNHQWGADALYKGNPANQVVNGYLSNP